jgi:hypothetical protein
MKYKWARLPMISNFIKKLNIKIEDKKLSESFYDALEDFLHYGIKEKYITGENLYSIFNRLNNINKISYLYEPFDNKKSATISNGIYVSRKLNSNELKYYLIKEISRNSLSIDNNYLKDICKYYLEDMHTYYNEKEYTHDYLELGFKLIEDSIATDMAENIYYASIHEQRPNKELIQESNVFGNNITFNSNFRITPSFQELTTLIANKLIGTDTSLYDLSILGLNDNFSKQLITSIEKSFEDKTFEVLCKLGIIYKKEMDSMNSTLIKDQNLKVNHVRKTYKELTKIIKK